MATISSAGIGSGLDVEGIVNKLMSVERQSLTQLDKKEVSYQARLSAYGTLKGALSSFQSSVSSLSSSNTFRAFSSSVADTSIITASASTKAVAGTYRVNVSSLAQAQTLVSSGSANMTAAIGDGTSTTLTFQFGAISGGSFLSNGSNLASSVAASGIAAGSLTINDTAISTSASTNSAKALATQINLATATTGVTATAQETDTGVLAFSDVTTDVGDSYSLVVGGVTVASLGASSSLSGADLDTLLATDPVAASLTAAGITVQGTADPGDGDELRFTAADGSNISITQVLDNVSGNAAGGITGLTSGVATNYTSSVSLSSAGAISVGGSNPSAAGLTAGNSLRSGASFTQDASRASGTVTIDSTNNSLQGIRDAINNANVGVKATIVSDGSSSPYRLVLTSAETGATSSMKISVSGNADLQNLLGYDPADANGQMLRESTAAQDTQLTVNGISVSSDTTTITDAIQGVTLSMLKTGSTSVTVSKDTATATSAINAFVKAYNELNTTIGGLTAYNAATKEAGVLLGDATARTIQSRVRNMLTQSVETLGGNIKSLSDVGIAFQKDGSLSVNSSKLQSAITKNFDAVGGLFAAFGTSSDSLVEYVSSTSATKAGKYAVNVTTLATQGSLVGDADLSGGVTIAADTELSVKLDGETSLVALTAGTYTSSQLASMLAAAINGNSDFSDNDSSVAITVENNALKLVSNRYGSASNITISSSSGTTAATLLGTTAATEGVDVEGTIGGFSATGSGQNLTGATGTAIDGLKLLITGSTTGDRGTLSFSRGQAFLLNELLNDFVGSSGLISSRTKGLNSTIESIGDDRETMNRRLAQTEKLLRAQYNALDVTISNMRSTSTYLTQQLASLSSLTSNN